MVKNVTLTIDHKSITVPETTTILEAARMLNTEFIMDMMFAQNPNVAKVGLLYSLNEPNSAKPIADA